MWCNSEAECGSVKPEVEISKFSTTVDNLEVHVGGLISLVLEIGNC